jgi:DNA-binding transcriptional ArsR family regulator
MIDPELIPLVAARFRVLGEAARLAILAVLQDGEKSVTELAEATGRGQPNVSQHLASLARAGLVSSRREGNRVYYRTADPYVARICRVVCDSLALRARREQKWMRSLRRAGGGRKELD